MHKILINIVLMVVGAWLILEPNPVPPLPLDNLIMNAWFQSANDPCFPSLDGWTSDGRWSGSLKTANPSPVCVAGIDQGAAARHADGPGRCCRTVNDHAPALLYQVAQCPAGVSRYYFASYFVIGGNILTRLSLYSGDGPDGPWTLIDRPLDISGEAGYPWRDWTRTPVYTYDLTCNYVKIEIINDYPTDAQEGMKFTGVYLGATLPSVADGPPPPTPPPTGTATPGATDTPVIIPAATATPGATPTRTPFATRTKAPQ